MKKIILLIFALTFTGCNYLPLKSKERPPDQEFIFKSSGIYQGTTASDWDKMFDVSFIATTQFSVLVNGVALNKYEFSVKNNNFIFGKEVTINPNGSLTFKQPAVPVAPMGSAYIIQWEN